MSLRGWWRPETIRTSIERFAVISVWFIHDNGLQWDDSGD
jgi:hypothetical protein